MPRITNFDILERSEQPAITLTESVTLEQLPQFIGAAFQQLSTYVQSEGMEPAEIPFAHFIESEDMTNLVVEIGFQLSRPLPGTGNITAGVGPGGRYATFMFLGPNETMGGAYEELSAWMQDKGLEATGDIYEHYHNGEPFPREHTLTSVAMRLVS